MPKKSRKQQKSAELKKLLRAHSQQVFFSVHETNTSERKSPENFKGTTQQSAENENPNVNKNAALKAKNIREIIDFCYHERFSSLLCCWFFFSGIEFDFLARDGKMIEIYFGCLEVLIKLVTDLRSPLLVWRDCRKGFFLMMFKFHFGCSWKFDWKWPQILDQESVWLMKILKVVFSKQSKSSF